MEIENIKVEFAIQVAGGLEMELIVVMYFNQTKNTNIKGS